MKYSLNINQKQALALGVRNINQAHILDLLMSCSTWAKPISIETGTYYWVARHQICRELPILNIKPDTAYRHLKKLADLELIDYVKDGKKDLVRLTEKGKSYYVGNKSEFDENHYVGNKSEKGKTRKQIRKNSDLNPKKVGNKSDISVLQDNPSTNDQLREEGNYGTSGRL